MMLTIVQIFFALFCYNPTCIIYKKNPVICIVGQGYVGLTLSILFDKEGIGFSININLNDNLITTYKWYKEK